MVAAADYWNRGQVNVPWVTGASTVMDCADIRDVCAHLAIELPLASVVDVGCGTGRLAQLATEYVGLDIASDAVAYCTARGLKAEWIPGPHTLCVHVPPGDVAWLACLSVFTHVPRSERQDYLRAFRELTRCQQLLVDIIPGNGRGDVALWTAKVQEFEKDLATHGWQFIGVYERTSPDGPTHRYYRCQRAL